MRTRLLIAAAVAIIIASMPAEAEQPPGSAGLMWKEHRPIPAGASLGLQRDGVFQAAPEAFPRDEPRSAGSVLRREALFTGGPSEPPPASRLDDASSLLDAALCDGTDETAKIQAYLEGRPAGTVIRLPAGRWCSVTSLKIPPGVTVEGAGGVPANPGGTNQGMTLGLVGGIRLEHTGTITLNGASGLRRTIVLRADRGVPMSLPAADGSAYRGDCITAAPASGSLGTAGARGADGYVIEDVLCVGQARALVSVGASRATVSRFAFDVNPGAPGKAAITFGQSSDVIRVRDLHGWPYGRSDKNGAALRSVGTGLLVQGQNDGLQIDGALLINFDIGADFQSTAALDIGRLWLDTGIMGLPGTRGLRFGANVTNVNIGLLEVWGSEIGLESAAANGNRNSIAIAHFEGQYGYPLEMSGGNLHIGNATIRNAPTGTSVIGLNSTASFLSGLFNVEVNLTVPPVALTAGVTTDKVADLRVVAPYLTSGIPTFGAHRLTFPSVPPTDPLAIPAHSDEVRINGVINSGNISGCWGSRLITIEGSANGGTLYVGGNILTASGRNRAMNAGSVIQLRCNPTRGKAIEVFYQP